MEVRGPTSKRRGVGGRKKRRREGTAERRKNGRGRGSEGQKAPFNGS